VGCSPPPPPPPPTKGGPPPTAARAMRKTKGWALCFWLCNRKGKRQRPTHKQPLLVAITNKGPGEVTFAFGYATQLFSPFASLPPCWGGGGGGTLCLWLPLLLANATQRQKQQAARQAIYSPASTQQPAASIRHKEQRLHLK
jgi:hypothetical protein